MHVSAPAIIIGIACVALAIVGIFRPFVGLLVFLAMHFTQPAEIVPALAPLRIELVYGVILFGALLRKRGSVLGRGVISNRILLSSLLLLVACCLSIPLAVWPGGAFNAMIYLAKLIALVFLFSGLIESNSQMRKVVWLLVALLIYFAGTGLFAYAHGEYYALTYNLGNLDRARGVNSLVGGPNELAGLLLTLIPFVVALLRCTRNLLAKSLLLAAGALALTTMVLTGSRSAMVGLAFVVVYSVFTSKHKLINLASCVVLGCVVWFSIPAAYQQRFLTVKSYAEGGKLDDSNEYRLEVWRAGWKMFTDHPLLGVGAGQFPTAFGTSYSQKAHGGWMNPHNLLLQVACELGIVGLIAFVYFLAQLTKAIRSTLRTKPKSSMDLNYQVALASSSMFLAIAVISVVGHSFYRPYWYLLGGIVAANRSLVLRRVRESLSVPSDGPKLQDARRVYQQFGAPSPGPSLGFSQNNMPSSTVVLPAKTAHLARSESRPTGGRRPRQETGAEGARPRNGTPFKTS